MDDMNNTAEYQFQDNSDIENTNLSAGIKQYERKNYQEALRLFLNAANSNTDSETYINIGNCHYMTGNFSEAENCWNRAISFDSKNSKAYANLGNLYYKREDFEKAISYWLVALISKPEDATVCLNLAITFNQKEMRFESIKYFEKYLKYAEDKYSQEYNQIKDRIQHCFEVANYYLSMGVQYQSQEMNKEAAACYFKSLANYPNLSKTNLNLGSIFFTDKNLELAVKYWTIASHIDPNYDKIYSNLAISYDMAEKFDYAYCYYNRYSNYVISDKEEYGKVSRRILKLKPVVNKFPEWADEHLEKAQNHLANSEFYDAIDEFRNYAILRPEEQQVYKNIIYKIESYLNPEKSIISTCFDKGNILLNQRKFEEAKPYFRRIMTLSSPQYLEFSKAKAKYNQCEKAGG